MVDWSAKCWVGCRIGWVGVGGWVRGGLGWVTAHWIPIGWVRGWPNVRWWFGWLSVGLAGWWTGWLGVRRRIGWVAIVLGGWVRGWLGWIAPRRLGVDMWLMAQCCGYGCWNG